MKKKIGVTRGLDARLHRGRRGPQVRGLVPAVVVPIAETLLDVASDQRPDDAGSGVAFAA